MFNEMFLHNIFNTRAHRRGGEYAVRRSSQHSDGDGSLTEVVDDVIFCPKLFEEM